MNPRLIFMLVVSVAVAGLAALGAGYWMESRVEAGLGAGFVDVVAAVQEIPFGTTIEPQMLTVVKAPGNSVPEGVFRDPSSVVGRVTVAPLLPKEVLLESRVVALKGDSALASVVQEGLRAFTLRTSNLSGPPGFLLPGNRVDLIGNVPKPGGGTEFRTFMRRLKVLAVDPPPVPSQKGGNVNVSAVTLEVDEYQAEEIAAAGLAGPVQVTLRNPLEKDDPEARLRERKERQRAREVAMKAAAEGPAAPGQAPQAGGGSVSQAPGGAPVAQPRPPQSVVVIRGAVPVRQPVGIDLAAPLAPELAPVQVPGLPTPAPGGMSAAMAPQGFDTGTVTNAIDSASSSVVNAFQGMGTSGQ